MEVLPVFSIITRGISEVKYKTDGTITVPADYILFRDAFLIHFSFFVPFLSPFSVFGHFVTLETRMVGRFLRENIVFNTICKWIFFKTTEIPGKCLPAQGSCVIL